MTANERFAIKEMRAMVGDLFRRNLAHYWIDFLGSIVIGYGSAAIYMRSPLFSLQQFVFLAVAVTFIYRASLFMHEVAHFRKGEMTRFKVVWNLLAGIPMLTPSFFYEPHLDHHNTRHYGTAKDGEYISFVRSGWTHVLWYASQPFVLPLLTAVRFLIMTPLSFLSPSIRAWTLAHWSSFVIDLKFEREIKETDPVKFWALIEVACHLRTVALFAVPMLPFVPWYQFILLYVIAVCVLILNHLRTLTAHRFMGDGSAMSHAEQLFDSNDIVGDPIFTEILMPVGLRFHALHHLFPGMPYHNLKKAHLRLMENLPADAPYRKCVQKSFFSALAQFYRDMREHQEQTNAQTVMAVSRRHGSTHDNRPQPRHRNHELQNS